MYLTTVFECSASCIIATLNLETSPSLLFRTLMNGPTSILLQVSCPQTNPQYISIMQPYKSFSSLYLSLSPSFHHPSCVQGIADDQVDLRREIAFNLSLIYQASGNVEMARQLINTHCIVWKCTQMPHHLCQCLHCKNMED